MWATITKPFAWLMLWLYSWTQNYGLSVIFFALIVNLILLPFMAKSKKASMRTTRIQPQIAELQKRHEGNQQKLQQEMQKLYREEGINPMSGCVWSLIPFPILIALYSVIRQPLTRMMYVGQDTVAALRDFFVTKGWYTIPAKTDAYAEIKLTDILHKHWSEVQSAISAGTNGLNGADFSRLKDFDFTSFGMNLGIQPNWHFWEIDFTNKAIWLPALGLFLIPLVSALLSWLSMKVGNMVNPVQQDSKTAASMKSMTMMMPIMSIWFCFIMPASMGVYWIANSLFGMTRDFILTKVFKSQLDKEDAERKELRQKREREMELSRLETERRHAEGTNEVNENTSKRNQKAKEKQQIRERKAALDREERAARREMLGIEDPELPASQVGNRRFARGRAYDPYRFSQEDTSGIEEAASESASAEIPEAAESSAPSRDFETAAESVGLAAVEASEQTFESAAETASDLTDISEITDISDTMDISEITGTSDITAVEEIASDTAEKIDEVITDEKEQMK